MQERDIPNGVAKIRAALAALLAAQSADALATLGIAIDAEIRQELKERVAALVFGAMVNDLPGIHYLAVWEEGGRQIHHLYMDPGIRALLGYSPSALRAVGYGSRVVGDILSFYHEKDQVAEKVTPVAEAKRKRTQGFLGNRFWEGFYQIRKRNGKAIWVIDRASITRYRNTVKGTVVCVSAGLLLETTDILNCRKTEASAR